MSADMKRLTTNSAAALTQITSDIAKRAIGLPRQGRLYLPRKEQGKCQGVVREIALLNSTVGRVASVKNQ
jgi:hypothetical protein